MTQKANPAKEKKVIKDPHKQPSKPKEVKAKDRKFVLTTGKRKRAIARAIVKPGKGFVKINSVPIESLNNELVRLKMQEPLILAGDSWKGFDIKVSVAGGGQMGQADAVRQAIAKGLVEYLPNLRQTFSEYDRNLLVYDPRRTEPHKPPRSSQGPRRYKQRSKR